MSTSVIIQSLLYGFRPTVGKSDAIAVTPVETERHLRKPGIYRITNMGPDVCHVRMLAEGVATVATTNDYPLSPLGSGDPCFIDVMVTPPDSANSPVGPNVLHAICSAGKTATLIATMMTRQS